MVEYPNSDERIQTVFDQFGWEVTPVFRDRYMNDAWIYNMANAMVRLHARVKELEALVGASDG